MKAKYRTANRYKVDHGNVTAEEILEMDKYAIDNKRKFSKKSLKNFGNVGVAKIDGLYKVAFSQIIWSYR